MMGDHLQGEKRPLVVMVLGARGQLFISGEGEQMEKSIRWGKKVIAVLKKQ